MLVAMLINPLLTRAQTVDEIIAKNIEARGGLAKLKSFKSIRTTGTLTTGGFRARVVNEMERPNKVRQETIIQGMTAIDAYDGHVGWRISPFEGRKDPDLLSADDRKGLVEAADIDGQLVDYKNKDHRAELLGHDSVEGTDCYKIKLTLSTGDVRYYYIDADTFLELKVETERNIRGTVRYGEILYGDYEQVDGVYFPFSIDSGMKGDPDRVKITVEKVDVNPSLPETRFGVPTAGAAK